MSIRRAGPDDLDALVPLVREFCAADGHPFDEPTVRRAAGPLLADDMVGQIWLVVDAAAGAPAGYGVVTWGYSLESGGRDALLDELYVRERNQGAGSVALQAMMAAAAAAGARRMFLETERRNERVRGFYARLGFVTEDSVWMSIDLPPG